MTQLTLLRDLPELLASLHGLNGVALRGDDLNADAARALEELAGNVPAVLEDWEADSLRHGFDPHGRLWSVGFNYYAQDGTVTKRWWAPESRTPLWETSECALQVYFNATVEWAGLTWGPKSCIKRFRAE